MSKSNMEREQWNRLSKIPAGLGVTSDSDSSAESSKPADHAASDEPMREPLDSATATELSYAEFAWKFLCLNPQFIEDSNEARHGTDQDRADVAAKYFIKRFKHHSEPFHTGAAPRFISSSISFWSNIDPMAYGEKRSISRRLRKGEVFILFNLKEVVETAEESLEVQLRRAEERLRRLLEKFKKLEESEKPKRLTHSKHYKKEALAKLYNLYLSTQFPPHLNDVDAYKKHFPSIKKNGRTSLDDAEKISNDSYTAMRRATSIVISKYRKIALFDHKSDKQNSKFCEEGSLTTNNE